MGSVCMWSNRSSRMFFCMPCDTVTIMRLYINVDSMPARYMQAIVAIALSSPVKTGSGWPISGSM